MTDGANTVTHSLQNKSIIITGAANGIGNAAAQLFAAAGARLLLVDRDASAGEALVRELGAGGAEASFFAADVSDEALVKASVQAAVERYGRLDGAFNNAGVGFAGKRVHELEWVEWQRAIGVDLTGVFLCLKYQTAAMLTTGGGSIVNTGSVASVTTLPAASEYVAAKHGVLGLTRSVAFDYGRDGIRVNAILPGTTRTPLVERQLNLAPGQANYDDGKAVFGRMASPEEIAQGALWLLSDAASFVTGAALSVDGGYTIS